MKLKFLTLLISSFVTTQVAFANDSQLRDDAKLAVANGYFEAALEYIQSMTPGFRATPDIKYLEASAHSGLCGLNVTEMVSTFSSSKYYSSLAVLISLFPRSTPLHLHHCVMSESLLYSIGPITQMTEEQGLLLGLNGLAKIGVLLSIHGDRDSDGTADASWDVCPARLSDGRRAFPDDEYPRSRADLAEFELGISSALAGFRLSGVPVGLETAVSEFEMECYSANQLGLLSICNTMTRSQSLPIDRAFFRGMIQSHLSLSYDQCRDTVDCFIKKCFQYQ